MNSKDITVTKPRAKNAVQKQIDKVVTPKIDNAVKTAVENERIRTGVITKFYPYLDKAMVKLDHTNKLILCKILHRYGGDLFDFYTPLSYKKIYDEKLREPAIVPKAAHHVCVLQIHDADSEENLILGYYQNEEIVGFSPAAPGNMKLMSMGEVNNYWINFGRDGLDLRLPKKPTMKVGKVNVQMEDTEYYTKEEVDEIIKDTADNTTTFKELLEVSQNYNETSENTYTLFRGDCWTINNNFESSAAITSETTTDFRVNGTFRTKSDMIGLYWNSKDLITHPYISYGEHSDYRGVTLEFDYSMTGCRDFNHNSSSITLAANTGEIYYLQLNRFINNGHVTLDFSGLTLLPGNQYIDRNGNAVTVTTETPVDVSNLKFIMFVLIPTVYEENPLGYEIMSNVDFNCEITNISVTNGYICNEHTFLEPHKYRLCEGYDDFYNMNPKRVCKEMRKLGYTSWLDLYIGASHFYEKSGTPGEIIDVSNFNHTRTEKMVLNKNVPLNKSFRAWLDCYSRELKANDCENLVISVSMENLQCPSSWRQKDCNGNDAITGWIPSTFFYTPCNSEVAPYMQSVSEACLDIVVANNMQPILQMGEAWWWWNENDHPNQPPCFYDAATKAAYLQEFGVNMPEHTTAWDKIYDKSLMYWLNKKLCGYSDKLREVVKSDKYTNGLYMALFFPPSVLDKDRVPPMMKEVNYIKEAYSPEKLDVLQLEDYDWVTGLSPETKERDRSHHPQVYTIGQSLGFPEDRLHYFGGFVQYPKDAVEYWREIIKAMDTAIQKGFKETFVWAGSQVRRDNKIIGYDNYELVLQLKD